MKVLLIEDDPVNRGHLTDALRGDGFLVEDVPDCETALAALRNDRPDLIVTDLVLPGMTGQTFLKRREVAGVPVIVMTASVDPKSLPPEVEFLAKPFALEDFMGRVRRLRKEYRAAGA